MENNNGFHKCGEKGDSLLSLTLGQNFLPACQHQKFVYYNYILLLTFWWEMCYLTTRISFSSIGLILGKWAWDQDIGNALSPLIFKNLGVLDEVDSGLSEYFIFHPLSIISHGLKMTNISVKSSFLEIETFKHSNVIWNPKPIFNQVTIDYTENDHSILLTTFEADKKEMS